MLDLNKIKKVMERESCSEHGKTSTIWIEDKAILFKPCCEKFASTLKAVYERELDKAVRDSFESKL